MVDVVIAITLLLIMIALFNIGDEIKKLRNENHD